MPYAIYLIMGPTGRPYLGLSKDPAARWGSHRRRAKTRLTRHPFYDALRKYGPAQFTLHVLSWHETLEEAQAAEVSAIAAWGSHAYNVSPGGEYDAGTGGKTFWERIKRDPEAYASYRAKLSAGVKAVAHLFDVSRLHAATAAKGARWRWEQQHRITRMARPNGGEPIVYGARLKESDRLSAARKSRVSRLNALAQHAARSEEERRAVNAKIADTLRDVYAEGGLHRQRLADAAARGRANMDRKVQGAAASKGLKNYWAELKKDPDAYAAHIARRRETLMKTLERKKNENL